jgi:hypothetical protein
VSEHAVAYFGSKYAVVGNVGQPCTTLTDSIVIVMVDPGFRIEYIAIIIKSNTIA